MEEPGVVIVPDSDGGWEEEEDVAVHGDEDA